MQRKSVIFVADSLDNAHKFQAVLSGMDADVVAGSSLQFKKLLHEHPNSDLIIFEASGDATQSIAMVEDVMVQDGVDPHHREGGHAAGVALAGALE